MKESRHLLNINSIVMYFHHDRERRLELKEETKKKRSERMRLKQIEKMTEFGEPMGTERIKYEKNRIKTKKKG